MLKFKQNICGFDILRYQGNSYVCDVNGFSFVKGNEKYCQICTDYLRKIIKKGINYKKENISNDININKNNENPEVLKTPIFKTLKLANKQKDNINQQKEQLKSIVAVFRHADRSPKQKLKFVIENEKFLKLFDEFGKKNKKNELKEIKLKKPNELKRVLEIANEVLDNNKDEKVSLGSDNFYTKIFQIKMVLETKINFDGLTRKIQMKPKKFDEILDEKGNKIKKITQALMILKWGGSLTHSGIEQARQLGNTFLYRLYPTNQNKLLGLLRLHSTYRHDLKCYSADEGRCLKTAASFLKGLLQLDGAIIPIISSMVRTDEDVNKLLDDSESIQEFKGKIKEKLNECLTYDGEIKEKFYSLFKKESLYPDDDIKEDNDSKSLEEEDELEFESDTLDGNDENINFSKNLEKAEENKFNENDILSDNDNDNDNNNENHIKKNLKDDLINFSLYESDNIKKNNEKNNKENNNQLNKFDELMEKIGNPLKRLNNILSLLNDVINNLQSFLSNEEDSSTYFITDKSQIVKREYDFFNKKKLIEKILGEDINDDRELESIPMERKYSVVKYFPSSENKKAINNIKEEKKGKKENDIYNKDTINALNETIFDCKDENTILIYKRYVKLKTDFFNTKKNAFDISKIPDIYDNIKYDIIHNNDLMKKSSYELYDEICLLANFVMPFEYGITSDEKLKIGLKIIKPLLKKMYSDLIDINSSSYLNKGDNIEKEDKNWSGLDKTKVNENEIKEPERNIKSRFYFTCASHMYALLNVIGYGYKSSLNKRNRKSFAKLKNIFDLDYCSHIIFRLFENFNEELQSPKRFRLEIIMSSGSNSDPREANQEHLIDVSPWITLNKNLNLAQMKEFLNKFN